MSIYFVHFYNMRKKTAGEKMFAGIWEFFSRICTTFGLMKIKKYSGELNKKRWGISKKTTGMVCERAQGGIIELNEDLRKR